VLWPWNNPDQIYKDTAALRTMSNINRIFWRVYCDFKRTYSNFPEDVIIEEAMAFPQVTNALNCSAQAISYPTIVGAQIRSLEASTAYTTFAYIQGGLYSNNGAVTVPAGLQYCNVTITYNPPDSERLTTVQVWLPSKWNERMQGVGGGGWSAGLNDLAKASMIAAVAQGYTAIGTNGGNPSSDPRDWAFERSGPSNAFNASKIASGQRKVDKKALKHYASTSLNDLSIIGKSVIRSFYGKPPRYSYWNGCSQGGRQGFMIAQEHPDAFDGIVASAPMLNWGALSVTGYWAQMVENEIGSVNSCELSSLTAAAIKKCDPEDGVTDGIISDPDACHFDPFALINRTVTCWDGSRRKISREAAILANTGWTGYKAATVFFRPLNQGTTHEAALVTVGVPFGPILEAFNVTMGLADRYCRRDGTCTEKPLSQTSDWIKYFVKQDPNYDTSKIKLPEFEELFKTSIREYNSTMGTNATDLSAFRNRGGKLLSFHGLVCIPHIST
jgi:hypothetical protein